MKNARLPVWVNGGWVVITLLPNESLTHHTYRPTEEGYHATTTTWTHVGDGVTVAYSSDGSDCDGRHGYASEHYCPLELLRDRLVVAEEGSLLVPDWKEQDAECYDEYAVAAGY